jgi:hypothetical protein
VSRKACGVFLWVILVVQSLLEGLTDGERLSDLQRRLDSLPADLETLFWRILNSVDFERVSQLFQIVRASPSPLSVLELSFADEDDPEFVFKMPTMPLPNSTLVSRAILMRRRLNACCKGLLEAQSKVDKLLPDAKVEYLHRTVKDFIQKSDVWNKLLSATKLSFDPGMRISVSRISCLKIVNILYGEKLLTEFEEMYILSSMHTPATFWSRAISSIRLIVSYGPQVPGSQVRLLDEIGGAVEGIMAAQPVGYDPVTYGECPLSGMTKIRSFLHLAVKLQLTTYVDARVGDLKGPNRIEELSFLLRMAVTDYSCDYDEVRLQNPSLGIVETLLQHGATLNGNTSWNHVLQDSQERPDLLMLLLRYGADPFAPRLCAPRNIYFSKDLEALAKVKREEAMRKGGGRRSTEKAIEVENTEAAEFKAHSKWFRLQFGQKRS